MRIGAFTKYFRILPVIPCGIEQAMRCVEMLFPENGHFVHSYKLQAASGKLAFFSLKIFYSYRGRLVA
jgi:hypothetical protein